MIFSGTYLSIEYPEPEGYEPGDQEHKRDGDDCIFWVFAKKAVPVVGFQGLTIVQVNQDVYGIGYGIQEHRNNAGKSLCPGQDCGAGFKKDVGNYAEQGNCQVEEKVIVHIKDIPVFAKLRN